MKAYKVFKPDWACRGFQYEVGKEYKLDEDIIMCHKGFHACEKLNDCYMYYPFNQATKVAEVELLGDIITDGNKSVTNHIRIVKELTWHEVLDKVNSGDSNTGLRNSGHRNSGDKNSGDSNTGHRNSGNWNSGDWNSGNWNSGKWNSCNKESGYFNSKQTTINVFNKPCSLEIWNKAIKPDFIYNVTMERDKTYKESWKLAFDQATDRDIELLKSLPNYDADVFYEITGIMLSKRKGADNND